MLLQAQRQSNNITSPLIKKQCPCFVKQYKNKICGWETWKNKVARKINTYFWMQTLTVGVMNPSLSISGFHYFRVILKHRRKNVCNYLSQKKNLLIQDLSEKYFSSLYRENNEKWCSHTRREARLLFLLSTRVKRKNSLTSRKIWISLRGKWKC